MATTKTKPKRIAKRPEGTSALNINLPSELLAKLDDWTEKLNASSTGARWSRTDVIRACLTRGADERGAKGEAP